MAEFKVSVIIPVFNAEKYVVRAIESALAQPEVNEVILVEDGSPDDALRICREQVRLNSKVKLFQHPNGINLGAGPSRNLAIEHASEEYIAFLDADDYMLSDRFLQTKNIFSNYPKADGVYEAIGTHFEIDELRDSWIKSKKHLITTVSRIISPDDLFFEQSPVGPSGYCHIDGWTVKRSVFLKTGYFDELPLHQDTALFMRFAMASRMYPGEIVKPVAMRGVHPENRISRKREPKENFYHRIRMWGTTLQWAQRNGFSKEAEVLLKCLIRHCVALSADGETENYKLLRVFRRCFRALWICPWLVSNICYWRYLPYLLRDIIHSKLN